MRFVLGLDISGTPFGWLSREAAATYYARNKVAWDLGEDTFTLHGGINHAGERSIIEIKPIIAVAGSDVMAAMQRDVYPLTYENTLLFKRDRNLCAYCGETFARRDLTRDHIIPRSRGGRDVWENCATACRTCNHTKGAKTPEEWGRKLLYVPYAPSRWEHFILSADRSIIVDQMDYLTAKLPKHSRVI